MSPYWFAPVIFSKTLSVGRKNRNCLCETCEKHCRGGYAPEHVEEDDNEAESDTDSRASQTRNLSCHSTVNLNERRTRRGVYAIVQEEDDDSEESDGDEGDVPLANA